MKQSFFVAWMGDEALGAGWSPALAAKAAGAAIAEIYASGGPEVEKGFAAAFDLVVTPATRAAHDAVSSCWRAVLAGRDDFPCDLVAVASDGVADVVRLEVGR